MTLEDLEQCPHPREDVHVMVHFDGFSTMLCGSCGRRLEGPLEEDPFEMPLIHEAETLGCSECGGDYEDGRCIDCGYNLFDELEGDDYGSSFDVDAWMLRFGE